MSIFTNTNKYNIFGLDVSDLSIKLVQVKGAKNKSKIQAIGKYKLKEGIISDGEILNQDKLVESIKEVIKKPVFGSVTTKNLVASLPENKTFIKTIFVEKSPNSIEDMILPSIESNIPYSLDEIYYDWQITSQNNSQYQVLISAVQKKVVDYYIETFEKAGLKTLALETESMAVCRCSLKEESHNFKTKNDKTYGLIDIGSKRTTMTIYSKGSIVLAMSINASGDTATQAIAETLQINKTQAEKAKIICGLDDAKAEGIISDILSEMIGKMIDRIRQIIVFFQEKYPDLAKIEEIYISGGGSNIKDLDKIIDKELGEIKVSNALVFNNIEEKIEKHKGSFTETHNLDIELLADKKKKKKKNAKKEKSKISTKQNSALGYATAIGLALRKKFD